MEQEQAAFILAYAFSDYLIKQYGFVLYTDKEPQSPLRKMTLKFHQDTVYLSVYPLEYAFKVLNFESRFTALEQTIQGQMKGIPELKKAVHDFVDNKNQGQ